MAGDLKIDKIFSNCKKRLPWMIILLIIGIVLLSVSSFITDKEGDISGIEDEETGVESTDEIKKGSSSESQREKAAEVLEQRLEEALGEISGVGDVAVTVTLETGPEFEYAVDVSSNEREVREDDNEGGERVTVETTTDNKLVLVQRSNASGEEPVVIKEIQPEIKGVLVVAQGAGDPAVRSGLSRAVQTVLGVPAHVVTVYPMK